MAVLVSIGALASATFAAPPAGAPLPQGAPNAGSVDQAKSAPMGGCTTATYNSTDVPRTIADLSTVTSTLTIAEAVNISTIEVVGVSISHTFASDLVITLVSPSNITVTLMSHVCSASVWTIANTGFGLADNKGGAIGSVCPPGQNFYRPAPGSLNTLVGQPTQGTWSLVIADTVNRDSGTLNGWGLRIGSGPCATFTPENTFTATQTNTSTNTNTPTLTRTPSNTGTPPTNTRTRTLTATPTSAPCGPGSNYVFAISPGNSIVSGVADIGNHGDDVVTTVNLPFTFNLYGQPFTSVRVSPNGNMQFTSSSGSFTNTCLPFATFNNVIMPYFDDLRTDGTGNGIFTDVIGTAPNRTYIVEWRTCIRTGASCVGTQPDTNFEVKLYETALAGGIEFSYVYGAMLQNGSSATVGVQKGTGTGAQFTQFSCNTPNLSNGLKIDWMPADCSAPTNTPTPSPTITSTPTLTVPPTLTLTPGTCGPASNYAVTSSTGAVLSPGSTLVTGSQTDDAAIVMTLPFSVNLYGQTFTTANVSTNGNLQFSSSNSTFTNVCLPTTSVNNLMAPHWDDLDLTITITDTFVPGIYTAVSGPSGSRVLNIEWRGCLFQGTSHNTCDAPVDFEVRMYEGQDNFDFIYGTVTNGGVSATASVQRGLGPQSTQFSCNTASLSAGQQLSFAQPPCVTATPSPTITPACTSYVVGHLTWQTIPQPNSRNIQPVTVTVKSGLTEINVSTAVDASGFFTVPLGAGFPAGVSADWRVKGPRHLASCGVVTVNACVQNNFEAGTQRGGDAQPTTGGNNIVNSNDFNTLKLVFGQGGNFSSDFDYTLVVNSSDFNIQKLNFGQAGCDLVLAPQDAKDAGNGVTNAPARNTR
jgi:subtilisin-like proprotein convertase family protein